MAKMIVVDIDKCTGCGVCELVCSFKHHDEFNPLKSRIHKTVFWQQAVSIPILCQQCENPWCARECPADAITVGKDPATGAKLVSVSKDECTGCKMCMLACPYGCIFVSDEGYAEKCDLCGGDPECVKFCSKGALRFMEAGLGIVAKKKTVAERLLKSIVEVK